jgi:hypothetical protein
MLESELIKENRSLRWSWDQYPAEHLDRYLIQGVEDPRINCQSILSRALIVDTLWPGEFDALIDDELRFGAVLVWLIQQLHSQVPRDEIHQALRSQNAHVPAFVSETWAWLVSDDCPIPNYITQALFERNPDSPQQALSERALDSFGQLWHMELSSKAQPTRMSVLEPACGSANDYTIIDAYGLAPYLHYTGFDISYKNIGNARQRFPNIPFLNRSIYDPHLPNEGADYLFVHDLFEHLSPQGLGLALAQVMQLTHKQAWLHFFNLTDIKEHSFKQVGTYYWNTLSLGQIKETLAHQASQIEIISIPTLLQDKFSWTQYHNQEAVTLLVTK